jgi:hypothetical protein
LVYETRDGRLMMVSYAARDGAFTPEKPRLWPTGRISVAQRGPNMDLAPDGKRVAVLMPQQSSNEQNSPGSVTLLLNFFDDLKQRVPRGGR